ncbi:MAG: ParA family protein [Kofleriaceae bacterium]|nr:ParA family protein [Kofleriaceae bacterium]MBP9168320.1 ParA family protein [Kofleriaceae bacterium]MBP9857199.1 ParA family protein [Kofleriaceae bacterium]
MTPVVTFFNNKGGVGKTSLVYHLAWMYALQGTRVLVADLDPQANLTALLFDEDDIERLWEPERGRTIFDPIRQMIDRDGGLGAPHVEAVGRNLSALIGTPRLAAFESDLAENWLKCLDGKPGGFKVMKAFWALMQEAADQVDAQVVLADVGPSMGAINRAALVASDHVVMPLGADLFSLAGIENLGRWLRESRRDWATRVGRNGDPRLELPAGRMAAAGYVLSQHAVQGGRPTKAYNRWMRRIPGTYAESVLETTAVTDDPAADPNCLGIVKHYRSLMPLAQEARKPIFQLRAADGALGSHAAAAQQAYADFSTLATRIAATTWRPAAPAAG